MLAAVKWDAGTIATTFAVYEIKQPVGVTQNNVFSIAGEQRNRGVELAAFGELVRGVRVLGGVAYCIVRASVENIADKDYWASSYGGYLVMGAPRTFKVSMTMDF